MKDIIILSLILLFLVVLFYFINKNIKNSTDEVLLKINFYIENFISRHKEVNINNILS